MQCFFNEDEFEKLVDDETEVEAARTNYQPDMTKKIDSEENNK